jgi:hypothetical protein
MVAAQPLLEDGDVVEVAEHVGNPPSPFDRRLAGLPTTGATTSQA